MCCHVAVQVLVGRNNKQNDELTNRVAKAGDVWMHARGCPGAHVLLRASINNRQVVETKWLSCAVTVSSTVTIVIIIVVIIIFIAFIIIAAIISIIKRASQNSQHLLGAIMHGNMINIIFIDTLANEVFRRFLGL